MAPQADETASDAVTGAAGLAELREAALSCESDRYFAATLAPAAVRYGLIALAAFAAEIARVPVMVREPLAGEIRLQWWRDALAPDGAAAGGHPIAMAIRATIEAYRLPADLIASVIDAQGDALHDERPVNETVLRARLTAGEGALFKLAARICAGGQSGGGELDEQLAENAGLAYGLSRALAGFPARDAAWLAIPRALLADDSLPSGEPGTAHDDENVTSAVCHLAALARQAHADATARLQIMSRQERLAFLPLAMVKPNLAALEDTLKRRGVRPFDPPSIRRLLWIGWGHATGRL